MKFNEIFKNVFRFQKAERQRTGKLKKDEDANEAVDYFLGQERKYGTLWQKYGDDLVYLKDRLLFYYITKPELLKNEDVRLGFVYGLNLFLNLMSKNEKDLTNKEKYDKIDTDTKPKRKKVRIY